MVCGVLFLTLGVISLTGCDLLGIGPKKQDHAKQHSRRHL